MGSPAPTSHRVSTAPPWGAAGATTVVTNRKSGPSWSRAAAATSSFWVDAGASDDRPRCVGRPSRGGGGGHDGGDEPEVGTELVEGGRRHQQLLGRRRRQ